MARHPAAPPFFFSPLFPAPSPPCHFLLPPFLAHRLYRCRSLGLFLTLPAALPELDSFPGRAHHKRLRMLRAGLRDYFVDRAPRRDGLKQFLQLPLGIDVLRLLNQLGKIGRRLFQDKPAGREKIAVEIDRTDQGFERIREGRITRSPARGL